MLRFLHLCGDICHMLAVIYILYTIISQKTCSGISGRSQILFFIASLAGFTGCNIRRTEDVFITVVYSLIACLNFVLLLLLFWRYRRTYERQNDTFRIEICLVVGVVLGLAVNEHFVFSEIVESFAHFTEATAFLPQLWMIRRATRTLPSIVHYMMVMDVYIVMYLAEYSYYLYESADHIPLWSVLLQNLVSILGTIYALYKVVNYDVQYEKVISDTSNAWEPSYDTSPSGLKKYKDYARQYYSYIDRIVSKQKSRFFRKKPPIKFELDHRQTVPLLDDDNSEDEVYNVQNQHRENHVHVWRKDIQNNHVNNNRNCDISTDLQSIVVDSNSESNSRLSTGNLVTDGTGLNSERKRDNSSNLYNNIGDSLMNLNQTVVTVHRSQDSVDERNVPKPKRTVRFNLNNDDVD